MFNNTWVILYKKGLGTTYSKRSYTEYVVHNRTSTGVVGESIETTSLLGVLVEVVLTEEEYTKQNKRISNFITDLITFCEL